MRFYCTLIDHNFLARWLALYESISRYGHAFRIWVLCIGVECEAALAKLALPNVELISLTDFEHGQDALLKAKGNREAIGYYYTCKSFLLLYVFKHFTQVDCLSYVDADLYFFGDPAAVFQEISNHSVAITPHRFPEQIKSMERYGLYNAGWVTFRRDANGLACLEHWRDQCLEWCGDYYDNDRYADQKYLDAWPEQFHGVKILNHPGINAAPWNLGNCRITSGPHGLEVNGQRLLLFHFSRLKRLTRSIYNPRWEGYHVHSTAFLRRKLYSPYLEHLEKAQKLSVGLAAGTLQTVRMQASSRQHLPLRRLMGKFSPNSLRQRLRLWCGVLRGGYLLVYRGRVIY